MIGEVHGAMTNLDEGDEHQMERRLYGRRRLEKVHCDAKRKHKATLPELGYAKHIWTEESPDHPEIDLEVPYHGRDRSQ